LHPRGPSQELQDLAALALELLLGEQILLTQALQAPQALLLLLL
jgi:hypothetical protein